MRVKDKEKKGCLKKESKQEEKRAERKKERTKERTTDKQMTIDK